MKKLVFLLTVLPLMVLANDLKVPSKISSVTVYLSGAQITRTATCQLKEGSNEVVFTGLSHKIDESSIQVSGLQAVSILAMAYDINYLKTSETDPKVKQWETDVIKIQHDIAKLKNKVAGLEEEEKVITTNRLVSTDNQALDLNRIKEISTYYRERITAIKNEVFETNVQINELQLKVNALHKQLTEANNAPEKEQGEISIKFDARVATTLNIKLTYLVQDAGWVPNYDIKSTGLNAPLQLAYKANVYQKTGRDWKNVAITLSTGNPNYNIAKPKLEAKYLNFVSAYSRRYSPKTKKQGYAFNPSVKKVIGNVTDQSGTPLPGTNIVIAGTTIGTQTDFDGNYTLEVPYGQELEFSYIGQITQTRPIYSSVINISMEEDATALDEVVVMGYGTSSSNFSTGSVSSISSERLLQGRTPSVHIRGVSSRAGAGPKIKYQDPTPLYIVDGVRMDGFVEGDLDQSEIQDIEILKGANAASIYGSRGSNGVVIITTKKSTLEDDLTNTKFVIKKPYTIVSNGDITAIEINAFKLDADYEYFAAPIINENVFLTASFKNWEKHQLLPGEANIYYEGGYAGKTVLDPYTTKKEMVLSLGIDPNIEVIREQQRNFKSKSFTGSNRILNRTYDLEIKNNKNIAVTLKLMDRIPKSQDKNIKVDDVVVNAAKYDKKNGLLSWDINLSPKESKKESFSFQVKYPKGRYISL